MNLTVIEFLFIHNGVFFNKNQVPSVQFGA